jgi:predicted alpha/beta hydrolase family esterase
MLEERDGHFTSMATMIEQLYRDNNDTKVVLVAHSLGIESVCSNR